MAEMKILTLEGVEHLVTKIDAQLETKVNIEQGKALSTNDYSNEEKQKLATVVSKVEGLESTGGMPNVIETVKVNNIALTPDSNKAVNIDLSAYALKTDVATVLSYKGVKATVAELPSSGNTVGDVWHVTANSGEYAWDGSAWQELGSTVDLSGYSTTEQVNGLISTAVAPLAKTEDVNSAVSTINGELALKAVKTEVDTALAGKSDNGHKHEVSDVNGLQTALDAKAVKTEVEAALALKANVADFTAITTAEIDALFV